MNKLGVIKTAFKRSKRQQIIKKDKNETVATLSLKEENNTHSMSNQEEEFDPYDEVYIQFKLEKSRPKSWLDLWQRPLNGEILSEEQEDMDPFSEKKKKMRVHKINKRQNNRKNEYIADMITCC